MHKSELPHPLDFQPVCINNPFIYFVLLNSKSQSLIVASESKEKTTEAKTQNTSPCKSKMTKMDGLSDLSLYLFSKK